MVKGRPVLLRQDTPLFDVDIYRVTVVHTGANHREINLFIPNPSLNLAARPVLGHLARMLDKRGICQILVFGAGWQRHWLDPVLCSGVSHRVVYSDVSARADVDLFCDAHDLPFIDEVFNAVVTTAVLGHVLYPERVASEIVRVLRCNGLLNSDIPFMQQVREGPYDFTRYTLSGHRRLFNAFTEIDAGMVAGPATALLWSIEHLALAVVTGARSRKITKAVVRLVFGWIKYLHHLFENRPAAITGASCTYFFGEKTFQLVSEFEIIWCYVGAKHLGNM